VPDVAGNINVVEVTSTYPRRSYHLALLMLHHSDVREAALLMIRRRGTNAAVHATQRALLLQVEGESEAAGIWRLVANEITRIRVEEREAYAASLALFNPKAVDQRAS
jgi:hypothetical protein